jgi:hypothetical protein
MQIDTVENLKITMASPLYMVPKKDGSWRPCGDYHRLNLVTTLDKYPLPNMQDLPIACMVAAFFQKSILARVITKSLLQHQTSQNCNYHAIWLV